jgi:AraC-like DNA-binding protein
MIEDISLQPGQEWGGEKDNWHFLRLSAGIVYWMERERPLSLSEGEMLIVPAGIEGGLRASQIGGARIHKFDFAPDLLCGFLSLAERRFFETGGAGRFINAHVLPTTHPVVRQFAVLVADPAKSAGLAGRVELFRLVAALFDDEIGVEDLPPRLGYGALARFNELVAQMPDTELMHHSPRQLAAFCGCSLRHFNRMFRNHFGSATRERQTELRLLHASQLLAATDQKIAEIAADCGYRNLSLFNTLFKRRFGMTPTDWRRGASVPAPGDERDSVGGA